MKININEVSYIKIVAKRWFQKSAGNTQHSVNVLVASGEGTKYNLESIGYIPRRYGYGDHYLNTAAEILGISEQELRSLISRYGIEKFVIVCTDVLRKKDL